MIYSVPFRRARVENIVQKIQLKQWNDLVCSKSKWEDKAVVSKEDWTPRRFNL